MHSIYPVDKPTDLWLRITIRAAKPRACRLCPQGHAALTAAENDGGLPKDDALVDSADK